VVHLDVFVLEKRIKLKVRWLI